MNRLKRLILALTVGAVIVVGVIWLTGQALGDHETLYQAKSLYEWREDLSSHDSAISNQANAVLNSEIIPQLTEKMVHDTNDSRFKMALTEKLNNLPGVFIHFVPADGRRSAAARALGEIGPPAKAAIPALIRALKGTDVAVRDDAARALGKIHGEPETVIPILIDCLDDKQANDGAAEALGDFGSLARPAIPKLLPLLLKTTEKEARSAAIKALRKIDPEAAAQAGIEAGREPNFSTNQPEAATRVGTK